MFIQDAQYAPIAGRRCASRLLLPGVFALGQVYVLISRVTDPQNFYLLGVPPKDMLEDVASALIMKGISVDDFFTTACKGNVFWVPRCSFVSRPRLVFLEPLDRPRPWHKKHSPKRIRVTGDWKYDASKARLKDRIDQKYNHERSVALKFRTIAETLNPQPDAHVVFQRLLDWIDRCDNAAQLGLPKPEFKTLESGTIFPEDDEPWWLTDVSKRIGAEGQRGDEDGEHLSFLFQSGGGWDYPRCQHHNEKHLMDP